jgi:chromosome segregation ATPase
MHAFKAVHADGTVNYSDTRPEAAPTVEKLDIQQNSAAIERQGAQRMQEIDTATEGLKKQQADEAQARRKYQTSLAEARQEVTDAERHLSSTQQSKKHATPERIGLAEQRVRLARQRLREVQSAGPSTAR